MDPFKTGEWNAVCRSSRFPTDENACGYQEKSFDNQSSHCERCSAMSLFEQQDDRNFHGHVGTDPLTFDLISSGIDACSLELQTLLQEATF